MRIPKHIVLPAVITVATCLSGCRERRADQAAAAVSGAAESRRDTLPRQIYHNLSQYNWYQRAEPLAFAQQEYMPRGSPLAIPLAKLRLAGNYQGVDFYVKRTERRPPGTVYVPVYDGYWLSFVAARSDRD